MKLNRFFIALSMMVLVRSTYAAMPKRDAIQLPSSRVLAESLKKNFPNFAQETNIHESLGGQVLTLADIAQKLDQALNDYAQKTRKHPIMARFAMQNKTAILQALVSTKAQDSEQKESMHE